MKLLIVRHADPDYSIDSLTPTGWEEAALLARRLSKLEVAAFYVSPLGRAKDTASLTLKAMGRTAVECPWLREFDAPIHKPGAEGQSIPWDWLPADWTAEPRYFDRDAWLEAEPMRAGNVAEQYRWVTGSLDELLAAHGYRILADAMDANLPYRIDCPALLLCGVHDKAASTKRYNRAWSEGEGLSLVWVPAAGHNSNTDNPVFVNRRLSFFLQKLLARPE